MAECHGRNVEARMQRRRERGCYQDWKGGGTMITHTKDTKFKAIETKIDRLVATSIQKGEQSKDVSTTRDGNSIFRNNLIETVTYKDINNIRVEITTSIKDYGVMK
tara:strand:- start:41 stop:358 length:318 start_codon:yes stop_codon:yes gene_type:complete